MRLQIYLCFVELICHLVCQSLISSYTKFPILYIYYNTLKLVERGRLVFLANTIENLHTLPLRLSSNFALTRCLFFFSKNVKTQISKYNCKLFIIAIMQRSIFIYIWWSSIVHYLAFWEWFLFPSTVLSDFELYIRWSNTSQRIQGFLKTNDLEMSFLVSFYWFHFIEEH